jgi:dihydrofolate reductase
MARPVVTLIAAVSEDGFISKGAGVPWDLPEDKAHFRRYTAGKWLLLGRRTFEEMQGWFSDHTPLVMTRDAAFKPAMGKRVSSVEEAVALAEQGGQNELVVCGGGQIYAEAMRHAQRLVITRVADRLGAGVAFPKIEPREWRLVKSNPHSGAPTFAFEEYERRG